jgi:phage baseplate assembly protein W
MTISNLAIDSVRYPFGVDAGAGRLAQEPDYAQHVEQMIRQVLLTAPGERINRPDFGCGLRQMVFAPNSDAAAQLLRVMVQQAVERWLDSVITVDTVDVLATTEVLQVRLVYVLKARGDRRYLNLEVTP